MTYLEWNTAPKGSRRGSADDPRAGTGDSRDADDAASGNDGRDPIVLDRARGREREVPGLSRERVEQIRRRINDDVYSSDAVVDLIARRMIAEGDV